MAVPTATGLGEYLCPEEFTKFGAEPVSPNSFRVADDPLGAPVFVCGMRICRRRILNGSLSQTSDSDDRHDMAGSPNEPFDVVWVACEDRGFLPKGYRYNSGVNDIRCLGPA
jgi:hypothetical protein